MVFEPPEMLQLVEGPPPSFSLHVWNRLFFQNLDRQSPLGLGAGLVSDKLLRCSVGGSNRAAFISYRRRIDLITLIVVSVCHR